MKKIILFLALIISGLVSCSQKNVWPRDRYSGPGGGLYTGPGGGMYTGPGGGAYTGPGGGLYTGPGGGLYKGSGSKPYVSNQPPREELLKHLKENKMTDILEILEKAGF